MIVYISVQLGKGEGRVYLGPGRRYRCSSPVRVVYTRTSSGNSKLSEKM